MIEDKNRDYKSLRKVVGKTADLKKLAETCVCFANAQGGEIIIGIEDKDSEPPANQKIKQEVLNQTVSSLRSLTNADHSKINTLLSDLRASEKVSDFIKDKEDYEILAFYQLINEEGLLTNLGILWLGTPAQRARLSYPVTIQYIVYNELDEKIRKHEWHFHLHNPKELLLEIEKEAVELSYSTEIPDGLFRKNIRQYSKEVIRELLINAIAHKKYTISGDIFIEVYPDRMTIRSPGGFPLGISKENILHERHRRNPHLIQLLSTLKLMEGEGSGYDLVYEKLAMDAKPLPEIDNGFNKVAVTVYSRSINPDVISILDYIDKHFQLTQKEYITLGVIATEKKIQSTQLAVKLQLNTYDKMRSWIGTLVDKGIIASQGIKKGTEYLLNPELFKQAKLDIAPSLKTLEPYKLEALIVEDLKYNGKSGLSDIQGRLSEVPTGDVKKAVYRMVENDLLSIAGAKRNRTYDLVKKK